MDYVRYSLKRGRSDGSLEAIGPIVQITGQLDTLPGLMVWSDTL